MRAQLLAGAGRPPTPQYDADIVILALERIEETLAAIASASRQVDVSKHIFVLDQGSCPETRSRLVQTVGNRSDVTLLGVEQNLGVAGGRNLISNLGHGRVIVAIDNDAEFGDVDTVACMVAALDAEPRLGAIGCRILTYANGMDDLSSWGYPKNLLPSAGESFDSVTYVGAGYAILRETWQQAGGYDASLFFCWEEFDLCLRAIALGWRIRYRGDIVIRHKVCPQKRVEWAASRWFHFVRNRIYIERKLDRSWTALSPRIAAYMLKGVRNGLAVQTLRAIVAAVYMTPRSVWRMPEAGLFYMERNDQVHRGSLWHRLKQEVLSRIGGPPRPRAPRTAVTSADARVAQQDLRPAKRCFASKAMTTGLSMK